MRFAGTARWLCASLLATALAAPAARAQSGDPFLAAVDHALDFAAVQLEATTQSISTTRYPSTTTSSGAWATTDAGDWRSGFFPGSLWLLYERTGDAFWRTAAEAWLVELEDEKNDTSTHDVGFKIFPSFGNAYRLTGSEAHRQVVLTAAGSLATRYSPTVGAIKSWDGPTSSDFRVIIDNMMNLEILFWGARNGGSPAWYDMAVSHALTTRREHVRADGSTYQVVNFDPATGAVKDKTTHQGYGDESTWSRGQGWAVYGFAMCWRETGDPRFLETARQAADYFVAHLPPDRVPYWDFELPSTEGEPRDSSAAAVAAAGLLELALLDPDPLRSEGYLGSAREILASLASPAYLAEGTGNAAILLHGTQNRPDDRYDTGLVYGDYYFVEGLLRFLHWFGVAPFASDASAETQSGTPVDVVLSATDGQECELAFAIVDPPANGSLGAPSGRPCQPGAPNADSAVVRYTPDPGWSGSDSFTWRASDGTNESNLASVAIVVHPAGGGVVTFTAVADSKVKSSSPNTNYGSETTLRLRAGDPEWRSYLRFDVAGLAGSVTRATLRLWVTTGSNDGGSVFAVANGWTETGLTWSNAPAISGTPLAVAGPVATGSWVEYDVTPAVVGDGPQSFALLSHSSTSVYFSSREGEEAPELVVASGPPPAPVPSLSPAGVALLGGVLLLVARRGLRAQRSGSDASRATHPAGRPCSRAPSSTQAL
jgi:unsaturated chondroitin disaccharide hydrolase